MKNVFRTLSNVLKASALSILVACLNPVTTVASHLVGGELTYQWVSGNSYTVNLAVYSDCSGISLPGTLSVSYFSNSCGLGPFAAILSSSGSPVVVTPACPASASNLSCNGGMLYSVERQLYSGTITFPANCNDWEIYYSECCRNASITNINGPASMSNYIAAVLNNDDFPFNNSTVLSSIPTHIIGNNLTTSMNWGGYDIDGDSLVFELVASRTSATTFVTYNPGYSAQQPIAASVPTVLDASTGLLTVAPNMLQVSIVAMKISEFRNGILAGIVYREFNIAVINSSNNLPELTGMNGTNNFITNGCPGDTITFEVFSSDVDPTQNLTVFMDPNSTNAAVNTTIGQYPVGEFTWSPVTGDISSQPYVFIINVADDHCDYYGVQSYAYFVYVNGCNTNDVWPGDANSDGTANLYDLLAVGLTYNDIGPVRPSASLTWTGQPCSDWNNWFVSGINHKHADTDGNGVVNADDTTAIMLNYGLNHPLRVQQNQGLAVGDLTVTANYDTVGTQMAVIFDIALTSPVDSIYGLAFRLFFDPSMVDMNTASITYPGSMFGTNGVDMIKIDKVHLASGFVDIALSRIDQLNISGQGPVARVTIVTTDNVSGKVTLNVDPTDVEANTAFEIPVILNTIGDDVVIDPNFVGINQIAIEQHFLVHPVPASDFLHIGYNGTGHMQYMSIFDINGKEVISLVPGNKVSVDISHLSKGVYYLKSGIDEFTIIKKIVRM